MKGKYLIVILIMSLLFSCAKTKQEKVLRLTAQLSAFGVENDSFPTIDVDIDFVKGTGAAHKSYYNPDIRSSDYSFSDNEMQILKKTIETAQLSKLKTNYSIGNLSDQSNSTLTIRTTQNVYIIKDYGFAGEAPLQKIYSVIYKFK